MADKNEHATVFDYLTWRGDLTFAQDGFNEVDNLILCIISYINFKKISRLWSTDPADAMTMGEVCAFLTSEDEQLGLSEEDYIPLMRAAAKTKRFGGVKLFAYESSHDDVREMQFNAVTFLLPDESIFVAFMGTDRSFAGWKEDFNMSFLEAVPAQMRAIAYTTEIARACPDRTLRIGGHSKGGNLAIYSAVKCAQAVQQRIVGVYNNDGPGFLNDLSATVEHQRIAERIHTVVPQSSVVGMLLEHEKNVQVVHSTYEGIMQHDGFSWEVKGTQFVHLDDFSREGKLFDETIDAWADALSPQQREGFSDALYEVLTATGARTLSELGGEKLKSAVSILKSYKSLDRETRDALSDSFKLLLHMGAKSVLESAQGEQEREMEQLRAALRQQKKKLPEKR